MKQLGLICLTVVLFTSCVSKKKYLALENAQAEFKIAYDQLQTIIDECEDDLDATKQELAVRDTELNAEKDRNQSLKDELDFVKKTNTNLLDRLSDLSVINKSGQESIQKSLEAINNQSAYIQELNSSLRVKDSTNLALVLNLKRSLEDINDEDVDIEVKKGVVYISLSDKMLFKSGSATILSAAETVLGKIAKVVNDHKDLDILVEGHTDDVPIENSCIKDNWDLSTKRATAVVRLLQTKYEVSPSRMTAGGRSEYVPKASNETADGRSTNRRTEIIILPKLDEFFQLLEAPVPEGNNN